MIFTDFLPILPGTERGLRVRNIYKGALGRGEDGNLKINVQINTEIV